LQTGCQKFSPVASRGLGGTAVRACASRRLRS
jgi:hypothetical protein